MGLWDYYKVEFKLIREMLGTCTEASIFNKHVLEKAKKQIKEANRSGDKLTKALEKFRGEEISDKKQVEELKGIIRTYFALTGKVTDLPDDIESLLLIAEGVKEDFDELVRKGDERNATVFQRDENGWPRISTHMILGNLKENLKIITNNGDKSIFKYKSTISEALALDVKAVEEFMKPSNDICKKEDGSRDLCERPLKFDGMHGPETAISVSESLPIGTTFSCTLRVRKGSPLTQENIEKLLSFGKNNGLGAWRGSGNRGAYLYKLTPLPKFQEVFEDGWM